MTTQTLANPKSGAYWALIGACGALLLCTLIFTALFFMSGDDEVLDAIASGQRITVNPQNGEITGALRSTKPVQPAASTAEQQTTEQQAETPAQPSAPANPGFDVGTEADAAATTAAPIAAESANNALSKAALVAAENDAINTIPVYPRTAASLAAAPNPDLLEKTQWGSIPIKAKGTSAFSYYQRPFTAPTPSKSKIAIVVLDVGTTKALAEQTLALPADITIAYNPYAPNVAVWMENGRNMGHEAWLMLPTQTQDFPASDPGSLAQLLSASAPENLTRLHQTLARASGYVGVLTAADSAVADRVSHLSPIMNELQSRGLALIAAAASNEPAALKTLRGGERTLVANLVLDEKLNPESIAKQLAALEALATKNGVAIGVIHATPLALKMLTEWHKMLAQKPLVLAPASALIASE